MKANAWLLAVSFIPFSIFGFLFAQFSTHGIKQPGPSEPVVTTTEARTQTNILFISVDIDAKPNPGLISVWGLFFSTSTQNAAEIIPLYPSKDPIKDTVLLSEFFLSQDKVLDPKFADLTQKVFQVKWDAFVVMDGDEIEKISRQLDNIAKVKNSNSPSEFDAILLQQLCSLLKSGDEELYLKNILDTQILHTNISPSIFSSFELWINTGQAFSSCEVQK